MTLSQIKPVQHHDLIPDFYKVPYKFLGGIFTCVYFSHCSKLRVCSEDKVYPSAGPFEFAGFSISSLIHSFFFRGWLPFCAHVKQIHEEIICE